MSSARNYYNRRKQHGASTHSQFAHADFVFDKDIAKDFDEYRHFGPTMAYTMFDDAYIADGQTKSGVPKAKRNPSPGKGNPEAAVKSLFSNVNTTLSDGKYAGRGLDSRMAYNAPLFDTVTNRNDIKERTACTIKDLVEASEQGKMGRAIYQYADFMFCKHLGKMPNNHLITLRRFPEGCDDHIMHTFPDDKNSCKQLTHTADIGRLVTWFDVGENSLDTIMKYNYNMPYESIDAKIEEKQGTQGGFLKNIFQMCDATYQGQVLAGQVGGATDSASAIGSYLEGRLSYASKNYVAAKTATNNFLGTSGANPISWDGGSERKDFLTNWDKSRTYGPLDVIMKTSKRKQGLEYQHNFTLTFEYELRSYDGVNGKAAFLDLLANILAVTFTTGKFWGGARKNTGAAQSRLYAGLPLFDGTTNINNLFDKLGETWTSLTDSIAKSGGLLETLKNVGSALLNNMLGGLMNKMGRPDKMTWASLLQDAPVGMWHVTIGNPRNPIWSEGDLILTNCEITHSGPLGIDDFPTQVKVVCQLAPAKPRDASRIEQSYLMGDSRIYTPMSVLGKKIYDNSKRYKQDSSQTRTATRADIRGTSEANNDTTNISDKRTSKIHWLTKQFGLDTSEKAYHIVQHSFDGAMNGSAQSADAHIKKK